MIPNTQDLTQQNFSIVGGNSQLEGTFHFKGETRIFSQIKGEIIMTDYALLSLERTAVMEGEIKCQDLNIAGCFKGKIEASGNVTVHPSASVEGTIASANLMIAPGAVVNIDAQTLEEDQDQK